MPLPLIIGLAAIGGAGLAGVGAHINAKETNECAQMIAENAQKTYEKAKQSLDIAQGKTEKSLLSLGYSKKRVLDTSISQFLNAYERIKDVRLKESAGINEVSKLTFNKQDALELREMTNIYQSAITSGTTGAAAGAVVALAASGSLPIVTGALSTAGAVFAAGEIGAAAGLAGTALSFGASMTPLAAIAAPVVLFTGISANIKADENFEKANTMRSEANLAAEKMKTSETLCNAITKKADMFNNLLGELNTVFSKCAALTDTVTSKKQGIFKHKKLTEKDLSEDELKLISVTCSLAHAIKAVIDTPIIGEDGNISKSADSMYNRTKKMLPALSEEVSIIGQKKFDVKCVSKQEKAEPKEITSNGESSTLRNLFALVLGVFAAILVRDMIFDDVLIGALSFSVVSLSIMNNNTTHKLFAFTKKCLCLSLFVEFTLLFYNMCASIFFVEHYVIKEVVAGVVGFIAFIVTMPGNNDVIGSFRATLCRVFGCICFAAIGLLLYAFIARFLGLNFNLVRIVITLIYSLFALISTFIV